MNLEKSSADLVVAHNTFINVARQGSAVIHQYWRDEFLVSLHDNLILDSGVALWFEAQPVIASLVYDHNLVFDTSGSFDVHWRNGITAISSQPELDALMADEVAAMAGNMVVDPLVTVDRDGPVPVLRRDAASPTLGAADDELASLELELRATFGDEVALRPEVWADAADIGSP